MQHHSRSSGTTVASYIQASTVDTMPAFAGTFAPRVRNALGNAAPTSVRVQSQRERRLTVCPMQAFYTGSCWASRRGACRVSLLSSLPHNYMFCTQFVSNGDAGAQRARPCQAYASLQPVPDADQPGRRGVLSGGAAFAASLLAPRFVWQAGTSAAALLVLL